MTAYSPDPRDLTALDRARESGGGDTPAALARRARYSRWDGSQQVADLDADEIMDALSDDVMAEGDLADALRRLMERGWRTGDPTRPDLAGLRDLMDRLERRREAALERYGLGDVLGDIRRELDEIVAQERAGVERRLAEASADGDGGRRPARDAARRRGQAARPARRSPRRHRGAAARPQDYDFLEPDARERFDDLVGKLRGPDARPVRRGHVGRDPLDEPRGPRREPRDGPRPQRAHPAAASAARDPDVREFLAKHGRFFPGAQTFDDIIDQLAARMAAMQSLLRSMSPEQRAELESMMDALLRDDRLLVDLAQLASNLDLLLPGGLGERVPFGGDEPLGLEGALAQIERLAAMDRMEDALSDVAGPERPRRRSTATRCATSSATKRSATSRRSTTSPDGSRRRATSRATGSGSS